MGISAAIKFLFNSYQNIVWYPNGREVLRVQPNYILVVVRDAEDVVWQKVTQVTINDFRDTVYFHRGELQ